MRIPLGTEIFPCRSLQRELGIGRRSTIEVDFDAAEIVARFSAPDPASKTDVEFVCLALPENPAGYDCYAVRVGSIEEWRRVGPMGEGPIRERPMHEGLVREGSMRETVLETQRLLFRCFHSEDAPGMYQLNQDPEVIRYTGNRPFSSLNKARELLADYDEYAKHGMGRWSVFLKAPGEYIGWCGLKYTPTLDEVDIGFRFFRRVWNQGIATEAARATLRYGFEELELAIIVGRAMEANKASHRVLEKIDMGYMSNFESEGHSWRRYEIDVNRWQGG